MVNNNLDEMCSKKSILRIYFFNFQKVLGKFKIRFIKLLTIAIYFDKKKETTIFKATLARHTSKQLQQI